MLQVENLNTGYEHMQVLRDINITVDEGETVSIIGANGAGKSTLLKCLTGLLPVWSGRVEFLGKELAHASSRDIFRAGIAHCPENRRIWPDISVEDHLKLGARGRRNIKEIQKDFDLVYQFFPILKERPDMRGGELSGGQQQMLAIGRALMSHPKMLLLDEPSLGLAPLVIEDVANAIREIQKLGITIMLVEQNARMALRLSNRAYVFETGRIVLSGSTEDLSSDVRVQKAYLGGVAST